MYLDENGICCSIPETSEENEENWHTFIIITRRLESMGFYIKERCYIPDDTISYFIPGSYFATICRFFSLQDVEDFLDDRKKHKYGDMLISIYQYSELPHTKVTGLPSSFLNK